MLAENHYRLGILFNLLLQFTNIFASGQLFGDTKAASFSIEEGAVFRGRSEMCGKKADIGEVVDIKKSKKA